MLDKFKKWFQRFTDPVIERITAPFGVTFVLVWSVHNWKVLFSIMSFTSEGREERISIIEGYSNSGDFLSVSNDYLWFPLLGSFVALTSYYVVTALSLSIATIYQRWIKPFIFNLFNQNEIISRDNYIVIKRRINSLQSENERLEDNYEKSKDEIQAYKSSLEDLKTKNIQIDYELKELKFLKSMITENEYPINKSNKDRELFSKLKGKYSIKQWMKQLGNILSHNFPSEDLHLLNEFLDNLLIVEDKERPGSYVLTRRGIDAYRYLLF